MYIIMAQNAGTLNSRIVALFSEVAVIGSLREDSGEESCYKDYALCNRAPEYSVSRGPI